MRKKTLLLCLITLFAFSLSDLSQARGGHNRGGYYGHHGSHSNHYGYLAGGLLLGAWLNNLSHSGYYDRPQQRIYVTRHVYRDVPVIYREGPVVYRDAPATYRDSAPVVRESSEYERLVLLRDREGRCYRVTSENGGEVRREIDPARCEF